MVGLSTYKKNKSFSLEHSLGKNVYKSYDLPVLTHEFLAAASNFGTALVDETYALMASTEPGRALFEVFDRKSICSVPTDKGPDPYLGEITRKAYVGERLQIPIQFKNITKKSRTFDFAAPNPLKNVKGDTAMPVELEPSQLNLDSYQTGIVNLTLEVSERFKPCFDYMTKIQIASEDCDPQFLSLVLKVLSKNVAPLVSLDCPCFPPVRRTHWSEHYYCDKSQEER